MKNKHKGFRRLGATLGLLGGAALVPAAQAFEFEIYDIPVRMDNLLTVGALMRMEGRDNSLVGKSNVQPGLCVARGPDTPTGEPTFTGDTCTTSNAAANQRYVDAPGSYNPNGDNGNLSFDRYDIVHAAAKITTDINVSVDEFNIFARTLYFFDGRYTSHEEVHPDTTMQPRRTDFSDKGEDQLGTNFQFLDYFVSRNFELFDRDFSIKVGNHVINWGESSFLLLNSLNSINPPDQSRLRIPGFDIKELSRPLGMVSLNGQVTETIGFEAFYQYDWKPILVDPVGSFFSVSDTLGAGGNYAMLSFGKAPEDPNEIYRPNRNPNDTIGLLNSRSDRTLKRDFAEEHRREPDNGGQYGLALKSYLENFNEGTELAFYYANYHSRVPSVSAIAADATCITSPALLGCGFAGGEPVPVGSAKLVVEYPEDIHLYGVSFNTNVGDWALSGEYAFRDNLPIQVHTTDLIFAALQPAFPETAAGPVPGRRQAVPDFVATNYRGDTVTANQYIRGYEREKIGQLGLTILRTVGGDNWFGASQITLLLEAGWLHLFGMPGLDELQFQGAEVNTHISSGADGSTGINPRDVRTDPNDPGTNASTTTQRQNPTRQGRRGFGEQDSGGYRAIALTRYDSLFLGVNTEFLTGIFHDVYGVSPGLGQNFVEGRIVGLLGVRFDYLSKYNAEIRYTYFENSAELDAQRDRDNLLLFVGYQF